MRTTRSTNDNSEAAESFRSTLKKKQPTVDTLPHFTFNNPFKENKRTAMESFRPTVQNKTPHLFFGFIYSHDPFKRNGRRDFPVHTSKLPSASHLPSCPFSIPLKTRTRTIEQKVDSFSATCQDYL